MLEDTGGVEALAEDVVMGVIFQIINCLSIQ